MRMDAKAKHLDALTKGKFSACVCMGIGFVVSLFTGCGVGHDQAECVEDLQKKLAEVFSLKGAIHLRSYTEASDAEYFRRGDLAWTQPSDFTLELLEDSTSDFAGSYHLKGTELIHIDSDSSMTSKEVDPHGDPIPNYLTQKLIPEMFTDTTWFGVWSQDSTLEMHTEGGNLTLIRKDLYSPEDSDYHDDTYSHEMWVFDARTGLPLQHQDVWYRGDLAYGSEVVIDFDWLAVNDDAVVRSVTQWKAPEWARTPEMSGQEGIADGGSNADWYEEALANLPSVGSQAPDLVGTDLHGEPEALAEHRGRLVYLDFWYIGCGPCMQALPHLAELAKKHAEKGFEVLAANPFQKAPVINRYLERRELQIPQLILDSVPQETWPIVAYPTWFLVNESGEILARDMGFSEESVASLDSMIQANL